MPPLTQLPAWQALRDHQSAAAAFHLSELFARDPARFEHLALRCGDLLLDLSKNLVTAETLRLLLDLARQSELSEWIARMFRGDRVNSTENRAALHIALRASGPVMLEGKDMTREVAHTLDRMRRFCEGVRSTQITGFSGHPFTDIVNIGIGGSDLGPALAAEALAPYASPQLRAHFVSNVDGAHLAGVLAELNPESTLFVVASKTFTTLETLANARTAREWLLSKSGDGKAAARHFAAVTANVAAAREFGVDPGRTFEFWDWVGGRYSLWSAVGLATALAIGMDHFDALRSGAREMDEHFATAPLERNLPVMLGMVGVWYNNFLGASTHAVLPYDQSLRLLPDYLQQLEMESNGKRVTRGGEPVEYATAPVIWGSPGTNGQHAFFQMLHQGTQVVPADFIGCCQSHHALGSHHEILMSNFFAQTEALMKGKTAEEARADMLAQKIPVAEIEKLVPHRVFPGNRPSTSIVLKKLDPHGLGALLALYEHKVFVQSVIWRINAFDQWGVELGKTLANRILPELTTSTRVSTHDASTNGLINHFKANR
ncbi:MAG TPA: glucose-6-phosphate isomerase [Burkholderiales bacterium]|nr:glucose-6-phosphate isomerase [Burkholderiales bacterium]